jgi:ABC-type Fe3+/spermidine/putrescine transport system ATPase subunit
VSAPAPRVRLDDVSQRYGSVTALDSVSLDIEHGEFITLLGPSGCGKTTLLRIVAGFIRPTSGRVLLAGDDVTRVPPHRRPVNMVFQRSTLFPHLDVGDNVAFGLRIAGVKRGELRSRVADALALVRLDGYEARRSWELSGGQVQRVALARALVNRPQVLLLVEPLSALDLKIRLEMEVELRRVHRETGATFVYVTHDQREALALSDRVVVLADGCIEQLGTPDAIYREPASPFTARFVGNANVIPVDVTAVENGAARVAVAGAEIAVTRTGAARPGPAWLVLRPEVVRLGAAGDGAAGAGGLTGSVADMAFRGTGFSYRVDVPSLPEPLKAEMPSGTSPHEVGSRVSVEWDRDACSLLPRDEGAP